MPVEESLIEYPCDFPLKIFGLTRPDFAQTIAALVQQHAPSFDPASMEMRSSSGARYISLTCTVNVTSRVQLDGIYQALCDHPMVKMVL
jgi:uncharacterized protein